MKKWLLTTVFLTVLLSCLTDAQTVRRAYGEGRAYATNGLHDLGTIFYINDAKNWSAGQSNLEMGWSMHGRINRRDTLTASMATLNLTVSPSQYLAFEVGAGFHSDNTERWPILRGEIWTGYSGFYMDLTALVTAHSIKSWEARFKAPVTNWLGLGLFGEQSKGGGFRVDVSPEFAGPLSASFVSLKNWDAITGRAGATQNWWYGVLARYSLVD